MCCMIRDGLFLPRPTMPPQCASQPRRAGKQPAPPNGIEHEEADVSPPSDADRSSHCGGTGPVSPTRSLGGLQGSPLPTDPTETLHLKHSVSVMRANIGAATSTVVDVNEAQWRAGVNRQAQPQSISHQQAASQAAAAKRKANAASGQAKEEAERQWAVRRNAAKRAKRTRMPCVRKKILVGPALKPDQQHVHVPNRIACNLITDLEQLWTTEFQLRLDCFPKSNFLQMG